jgi:hypothetical protein
MKYWLLMLLLLVPCVTANESNLEYNLSDVSYELPMAYAQTQACIDEWNHFMGSSPQEHIRNYCNAVDKRSMVLMIIIFIMVLMTDFLRKKIYDRVYKLLSGKHIYFLYRWITLGLLFLVIYVTILRGGL